MKLEHKFVVPAPVEQTWAAFNDLERVVPCFPGATLTGYEGDDFTGSCKVKLGPVSLQYSGTGSFLERDESDHHAVIEAKGKDRRGNGTATARVTARLAGISDGSTEVTVDTDLTITGRPAQFGRGLIQDVSNKLLDQFTTCLKSKLNQPASGPATEASEGGGAGSAQPAATAGPARAAGATGRAAGATGRADGAMDRSAAGDSPTHQAKAADESSDATMDGQSAGTARENSAGTAGGESVRAARGESAGTGQEKSAGTGREESAGTGREEPGGAAREEPGGAAREEPGGAAREEPGAAGQEKPSGAWREESADGEAVALDLGSTLLPMLAKRAAPYLIGAVLALVLRRLFRR